MDKLLFENQEVKTVGDIFSIGNGVLYFINKVGEEVEDDVDIMPDSTNLVNVRHIKNDEYEIMVDL